MGIYLQQVDTQGIQDVKLFANGCSGQNKNTVVVAMLLCTLTIAIHFKTMNLNLFEPYHRQNEGDSAHSAISTALTHAEDVFIPCELEPLLRLARRVTPHNVHTMNVEDSKDYKNISESLRTRSVREFDSGTKVDWRNVREVMVTKEDPTSIFIKTSHLSQYYEKLTLKRNTLNVLRNTLSQLISPKNIGRKTQGFTASMFRTKTCHP